ncbi:MAG: hypothetical protein U0840_07795 [Gemmataceae bacterium]
MTFAAIILGSLALVTTFLAWQIHQRGMGRWLGAYLLSLGKRTAPGPDQEIHLILCIADHFEPRFRNPSPEEASERVHRWREEYPRNLGRFRDSDGRMPRHTFFFPAEEYAPEYIETLIDLCAQGHGEVEVHLHHDADTPGQLREKIVQFRDRLANQHGLLARHRQTGEVAYGFIHGNWALCNSAPDGRFCGVNNELDVLRETGCYADLTMPSAPSPTQPPKLNCIYYAVDRKDRPRSHDEGVDVGQGPKPPESLMLIQGPLLFDWHRRKWGVFPRLENGCLQKSQPPSIDRLPLWLRARVQVPARKDWFFVKLYCHGTIEEDHNALLGDPMVQFHADLAQEAARNPRFHYHYVTAREMYNLVRAAEAGWTGTVADALDYELLPGPAIRAAARIPAGRTHHP